jgi:thiamine pyrophosphate-dependent acetolactate synthase large subunit-like protein
MFPLDVQATELSACDIVTVPSAISDSAATYPALRDISRALAAANAPLVIAGSGIFYNGSAPEMLQFCTDFHIPIVTPIWDRGAVDQRSRIFMGVVGAATGGPAVLSDADCILLAGAEIDYRIGYLQPPFVRADARIFRIGGDWSALAAHFDQVRAKQDSAWLATCLERREDYRRALEHRAAEQARQGLHAIHIIRAIEEVLIDDPVLLIDGGSIGQWAQ